MLKRFSTQSGNEVIFPEKDLLGVTTRPVQGKLTVTEALVQLLSGTGLVFTRDAASGSFVVRKAPNPNADRSQAAPSLPAATNPSAGEAIVLTVFEVKGDANDSYQALNTNAISGTSIELRRLPISADVITRTLLDDLALNDGYSTLLAVSSVTAPTSPSASTTDPAGGLAGDRFAQGTFGMRGVTSGQARRNGLLTTQGGLIDNFLLSRYEIIRGPQALLYGSGNAGGLINLITKRPSMGRNRSAADYTAYEEGGFRASAETDQTFTLPGQRKLGILATTHHTRRANYRPNIERESSGWFLAATFKPFSGTTLRGEFNDVWQNTTSPNFRRNTLSSPNHADPDLRRLNGKLLKLIYATEPTSVTNKIAGGRLNFDNLDSLGYDFSGEWTRDRSFTVAVEQRFTDWLDVQIQGAKTLYTRNNRNIVGTIDLVAPPDYTSPWLVNLRPQSEKSNSPATALRATVNAKLDKLKWIDGNLAFGAEDKLTTFQGEQQQAYEIDAEGRAIVNPATALNTNAGRNLIPPVTYNLADGFDGPFRTNQRTFFVDGRSYALTGQRVAGLLPPTAANPFGFSPNNTSINDVRTKEKAVFGSLFTTWWKERLDLFMGYRRDRFETWNYTQGSHLGPLEQSSYNFGANLHLPYGITPYYGRSSNFRPPNGSKDIFNVILPGGRGRGEETGIKLSAFDQRLSGSIAYYRIDSVNETAAIPTNVRNIADPNSQINGINGSGGTTMAFDRETRGWEITLSARPTANWRLTTSFSRSDGKEGGDVILPIFYNDQFRVNSQGQLLMDDGQILRVPITPGTTGWNPRSPNPAIASQPLTVAILRSGDASGNYRASLDPNSGRINNSAALFMESTQSGVGTGVVGLPVTQHQLGFVAPNGGVILARKGGDLSTGFAANVFNFTSVYAFNSRWLKGVSVGGNFRIEDDWRGYYYTDSVGNRVLLKYPDIFQTGLIFSYQRKILKRFTWKTQLNISNALNHYSIRRLPGNNGDIVGIVRDAVPREAVWTNSISF